MINKKNYTQARENISFIDTSEVESVLQLSGTDVLEVLDEIIAGNVTHMRLDTSFESLFLKEDGTILDIGHLLNIENQFLLIINKAKKEIIKKIILSTANDRDVKINDLEKTYKTFSLEGPYAWKLAKILAGDDIIGLRIHQFIQFDSIQNQNLVLRSSLTGEYGFKFILNLESWENHKNIALNNSEHPCFLLSYADIELLAQEVRYPIIDVTLREGECPLENSIRYMIDFKKSKCTFSKALEKRKLLQSHEKVAFVSQEGDFIINNLIDLPVQHESKVIGRVDSSFKHPDKNIIFGYLSLEINWAYPNIKNLIITTPDGSKLPICTVSSPVTTTKSMNIDME